MGNWDRWFNPGVLFQMSRDGCIHLNENLDDLRSKRVKLMLQIWDHLIGNKVIDPDRFKLSFPLVNEVVEHYLDDVKVIKCRYKINDKIQLHKVAGLLTSLIVRYRPIVPIVDEYDTPKEIYTNEIFAVMHGLAICGEFSIEECEKISSQEWFDTWFTDFLYLLHSRNHTAESLIFVFQTFCIFNFPSNFQGQ